MLTATFCAIFKHCVTLLRRCNLSCPPPFLLLYYTCEATLRRAGWAKVDKIVCETMILLDPKKDEKFVGKWCRSEMEAWSTKKISLSLINLQWANNLLKMLSTLNLTFSKVWRLSTLLQCLSDLMLESVLGKKISYVGNAESIHVRN